MPAASSGRGAQADVPAWPHPCSVGGRPSSEVLHLAALHASWQGSAGAVVLTLMPGGLVQGALPPEWGTGQGLANLTTLDLSSNNLTSSIPPAWGLPSSAGPGLAGLSALRLHGNQLAGSLPSEWETQCAAPPAAALSSQGQPGRATDRQDSRPAQASGQCTGRMTCGQCGWG